jgi:phosphomethylpyrimidine synthase
VRAQVLQHEDHAGSAGVAAKQDQPSDAFIAAEDVEAGMAEMSEKFRETGSELYLGPGGREHD